MAHRQCACIIVCRNLKWLGTRCVQFSCPTQQRSAWGLLHPVYHGWDIRISPPPILQGHKAIDDVLGLAEGCRQPFALFKWFLRFPGSCALMSSHIIHWILTTMVIGYAERGTYGHGLCSLRSITMILRVLPTTMFVCYSIFIVYTF